MFQEFTGKQNLQIDIAGSFGLDKLTWDERLSWFREEEHRLHTLVEKADKPQLFQAGLWAWEKAKAGKPSGYGISLDATASGIQLLACLSGCRDSALLCNVVDAGRRMDAYTHVHGAMKEAVGSDVEIDRKEVKQAMMTAFYGSEAQPKKCFGEGSMLSAFYQVVQDLAPGAWELNQYLLGLWDKERTVNDWLLPDGFDVRVKVMGTVVDRIVVLDQPMDVTRKVNAPSPYGRSLGANCIHSVDGMVVREMVRRCSYDPVRVREVRTLLEGGANGTKLRTQDDEMVQYLSELSRLSGFMSARILDHLTCENAGHLDPRQRLQVLDLIASLPRKPFHVLTVHDCFRCLPNYGNDLRRCYNRILSEIAGSNMLDYLVSQIARKPIGARQLDDGMHADVLDANYALS